MKILLATADTDLQLSLGLALSETPGTDIAGTASEINGLRALIKITRPDIVIVDGDLPNQPVIEVVGEIHQESPKPRWIVLGASNEDKDSAMKAGADAYIVKGEPPETLLAAYKEIRSCLRDQSIKPGEKE